MNCDEAAEFVSALCDGERIPRLAAEHVGACESCTMRLKQYLAVGAELRRMASLESPVEAKAQAWETKQRNKKNLWHRGWGTMRIPRLAFALLVVAVVVLGSSLVVVKVRAHTEGKVLMLTVKTDGSQPMHCPLSPDDKRWQTCGAVPIIKGGLLMDNIRFISRADSRVELGVRAKFTPFVAGKTGTVVTSFDEIRNLPEATYWFEPGETLEIEIAGLGTMLITGEWVDHMPSIAFDPAAELDPRLDELRVISPVLLNNKREIFDFEGFTATDVKKDQGVFMYTPSEGRYILSLSRLEGAVQGHINQSRVSFEINGESYTFLMAAPVARSATIWVLHQPNYRPSQEPPPTQDDQSSLAGAMDISRLKASGAEKN